MRSAARRIALVAGGVALLVGLFVVLRQSGTEETSPSPPPPPTTRAATTTAVTTTGATTTAEPPTPPAPRRFRVVVRNGSVPGGIHTFAVTRGERFVVIVRADVADEVHVHGYDRMADVAPGRPAQIALRATIPGRFDVELEDRHLLIARLVVRE